MKKLLASILSLSLYCSASAAPYLIMDSHFSNKNIMGNTHAIDLIVAGKSVPFDVYRKSGDEKWIETPFPADFIRGCYDGDGYIKQNLDSIGLVGSYELLNSIQRHFLSVLNVTPKKIGEHGSIFRIEYTSKADKKAIANYLWYDGCVSLDRKQILAEKIKKIC